MKIICRLVSISKSVSETFEHGVLESWFLSSPWRMLTFSADSKSHFSHIPNPFPFPPLRTAPLPGIALIKHISTDTLAEEGREISDPAAAQGPPARDDSLFRFEQKPATAVQQRYSSRLIISL